MSEDGRARALHEYWKFFLTATFAVAGALFYVWSSNDKFDRRIAELETKKLQAEATVASLTAQVARLEKQGTSARGPQGERGPTGPPGPQGERGAAAETKEIVDQVRVLASRVQEVERRGPVVSSPASNLATLVATPAAGTFKGGCFAFSRQQRGQIVINVVNPSKPIPLCWSDGTFIAAIESPLYESYLYLKRPDGGNINTPGSNDCRYGSRCPLDYDDVRVTFAPTKTVGEDGTRSIRLLIENLPK